MVVPDRETPGTSASAWPKPIRSASIQVVLPRSRTGRPGYRDSHSTVPVNRNAKPTYNGAENRCSSSSFQPRPKTAAGIEPTTSRRRRRRGPRSPPAWPVAARNAPVTRAAISDRNTTRTAISVPRCTMTSKSKRVSSGPAGPPGPLSPNSCWYTTRWPELLTGRNSVTPWRNPRINAWCS